MLKRSVLDTVVESGNCWRRDSLVLLCLAGQLTCVAEVCWSRDGALCGVSQATRHGARPALIAVSHGPDVFQEVDQLWAQIVQDSNRGTWAWPLMTSRAQKGSTFAAVTGEALGTARRTRQLTRYYPPRFPRGPVAVLHYTHIVNLVFFSLYYIFLAFATAIVIAVAPRLPLSLPTSARWDHIRVRSHAPFSTDALLVRHTRPPASLKQFSSSDHPKEKTG